MTEPSTATAPLVALAWSRVFSPLVEEALRRDAWDQLGLPAPFAAWQSSFDGAFHVGFPEPRATLVLHALLGLDGGSVREEMVRILEHLDLEWGAHRLQPDHLACVLELLAAALVEGEAVLVEGLCDRYLVPWCAKALPRLRESPELSAIVEQLDTDLRDLRAPVSAPAPLR